MFYYKLRFKDKEQALKVLNFDYEDWEVNIKHLPELSEYDSETDEYTVLEGYHVDIVSRVELDLKEYEVTPKNELHRFA